MAEDAKVKIACAHCKASFLVPGPAEGKKFRCPKCKEIFATGGPSKATRSGAGPSTRSVPRPVEEEVPAVERTPARQRAPRRELAQKKREEQAAARRRRMKVVVPIVAAVVLLGGGTGGFFAWRSAKEEEARLQERRRKEAADKKVEEAIQKARTLLRDGSNSEAASALAEAVGSESDRRGEAQVVRAAAKVGLRDFPGALADIDAALAAFPALAQGWEPHYYRGAALLATRREAEALDAIHAATSAKEPPSTALTFSTALSEFVEAKRKALADVESHAAALPEAPSGMPAAEIGAFDLVLVPDAWDRPGWRLAGSTEAAVIAKPYRPDDFPIPLLVLREDTPFGVTAPMLKRLSEKGLKRIAFAARTGGGLALASAALGAAEASATKVEVVERDGKAAVAIGGKAPEPWSDSIAGRLSGDVALSIGAFVRPSEAIAVLAACAKGKGKATIVLEGAGQDEGALAAALSWLARHQEDDGHWGVASCSMRCQGQACASGGEEANDPGLTGLGALAFLSAGIGPGDARRPGFGRVAEAALDWIAKRQEADGALAAEGTQRRVLLHELCALALVQAVRLGGEKWKDNAQKAVAWLDKAIGKEAWGYQAGDEAADTVVTGWAVIVLSAARAAGLSAGDAGFDRALAWTEARTDTREFEVNYRPKIGWPKYAGQAQFPRMAAQALLVRLLAAGDASSPRSLGYASLLAKELPVGNDKGTWDSYYWLVGTPALWMVDGASGGKYWKYWSKAVASAVAPNQLAGEECFAGSWLPDDPWGHLAGRAYITAANAMTLSVLTGRDTLYRGLKLGK